MVPLKKHYLLNTTSSVSGQICLCKNKGVSCYNSKHKAMLASEEGANYVAFGAFYHTKTKIPKYRASIDIIEDWSYISNVACVAIGGITSNNCSNIVNAGADYIAVISAIWNDKEGPMKAVMKFTTVLNH